MLNAETLRRELPHMLKRLDAGREHLAPGDFQAIREYVEDGLDGGTFWRSVFEGDLYAAGRHADAAHRAALGTIVLFLWEYAPSVSVGGRIAVSEWCRAHVARREEDEAAKQEHGELAPA